MARDRGAENLSRVHGGMTKPLEDAAACADMQYGVLRVLKYVELTLTTYALRLLLAQTDKKATRNTL